jgi:hypothetical protein
MLVSSTSPAPRRTHSAAHATASRSVGARPPFTYTRKKPAAGSHLASMLATTHCAPKRHALSVSTAGRATAAELMLTLSAPARSASPTSSAVRTPPPTVSGTNSRSAVRATTSHSVARSSWLAEMSRKVTSSAPSAS